ncbi:transketolase-like TK C-terminal-containing protein [Caballeronia mineralivorans]|uniref:transketolase-like TK C-terminal-containing protein n=1 Tax=Caballeronia mineralivorans TaxID=2010198 RepID=UPI002AFDFD14|nr:hypothetical protein [Caballeronia mineralivorans]MEA3102218.1 transketolase [Caballeronia mineralivorans]
MIPIKVSRLFLTVIPYIEHSLLSPRREDGTLLRLMRMAVDGCTPTTGRFMTPRTQTSFPSSALKAKGIGSRVVSMPSWDLFEKQELSYCETVLPPQIRAKVTVEHGPVIGWDRYAGSAGQVIGMHTFGSSAPLKDLLKKFGFTPERVLEAAMLQIERSSAA